MDINTQESLEFAGNFNYDRYGLITNPGKFERECQWLPYYYNMALLDAQDDTVYDYIDGIEIETQYDVFYFTQEDYQLFPDLINSHSVAIWEDSCGFVHAELDPDLSLRED